MAIVLLRGDQNYEPWMKSFRESFPELPVYTPDQVTDPKSIRMAWTWKAPRGSYAQYPNLEVIGSLGAGVDHLFDDPSLPGKVILTRVVDPYLTGDMAEFVLALCLNAIKNLNTYHHFQEQQLWKELPYRRCNQVKVGILGLGTLGQATGQLLHQLGFQVMGWSKSKKAVEGIQSFAADELEAMLAQSAILICLLPLTSETQGVLNASLFAKLPRAAHLINVGRGGHLQEDDLIPALKSGQLSGASLDVVSQEPLPQEHPFWSHPKIHLTPHIASVSAPSSVVSQLAENYERFIQGEPLKNQVSREDGY
ncbi:2-hydroxyacid dehydrogenase [Croceiramulus getboli]|nr:glyoxylate/hydroxypyruvate reductase A [Flavobacteriaceae bacterium YJPT1-3]